MRGERQQGGGGGAAAAPHGILLAIVVGIVVVGPFLVGETLTEAISEMLSPVGLILLPIVLLLAIQFLSSDRGSFISAIFSTGEPNTIHRLTGSPVAVAFFLILILFFLYNRVSIFGDHDSAD
ncbi:Transmembrane protein [Sesbania bispinosa]|nr:Transmembrane protein [Sesbania bispinosa]